MDTCIDHGYTVLFLSRGTIHIQIGKTFFWNGSVLKISGRPYFLKRNSIFTVIFT